MVQNIQRGNLFDENFLMSIATLGAFLLGEFPEAVAVMLFYQIGEYFQDKATSQSRQSIARLMDIRSDKACSSAFFFRAKSLWTEISDDEEPCSLENRRYLQ